MAINTPIRKLSKLIRKNRLNYWYYQKHKSDETFRFDGRDYAYVYHRHNVTWMNERAVELPIVWDYVRCFQGQHILEIGNVLSHYFPTQHDVVDKYERAPGVINQDVVEFQAAEKYDLIVSISTLEHVGWDETPREPEKIPQAIERMLGLLKPSGTLVTTVPLGYNAFLDQRLADGRIQFDRQHYLKRISADNRWLEVPWDQVEGTCYGTPYFYANALVVGIYNPDPRRA